MTTTDPYGFGTAPTDPAELTPPPEEATDPYGFGVAPTDPATLPHKSILGNLGAGLVGGATMGTLNVGRAADVGFNAIEPSNITNNGTAEVLGLPAKYARKYMPWTDADSAGAHIADFLGNLVPTGVAAAVGAVVGGPPGAAEAATLTNAAVSAGTSAADIQDEATLMGASPQQSANAAAMSVPLAAVVGGWGGSKVPGSFVSSAENSLVGRMAANGMVFGTGAAAQRAQNNVIAGDLSGYDPDRNWYEGVLPAFGYGFAGGAAFTGATGLAGKAWERFNPPPEPPPAAGGPGDPNNPNGPQWEPPRRAGAEPTDTTWSEAEPQKLLNGPQTSTDQTAAAAEAPLDQGIKADESELNGFPKSDVGTSPGLGHDQSLARADELERAAMDPRRGGEGTYFDPVQAQQQADQARGRARVLAQDDPSLQADPLRYLSTPTLLNQAMQGLYGVDPLDVLRVPTGNASADAQVAHAGLSAIAQELQSRNLPVTPASLIHTAMVQGGAQPQAAATFVQHFFNGTVPSTPDATPAAAPVAPSQAPAGQSQSVDTPPTQAPSSVSAQTPSEAPAAPQSPSLPGWDALTYQHMAKTFPDGMGSSSHFARLGFIDGIDGVDQRAARGLNAAQGEPYTQGIKAAQDWLSKNPRFPALTASAHDDLPQVGVQGNLAPEDVLNGVARNGGPISVHSFSKAPSVSQLNQIVASAQGQPGFAAQAQSLGMLRSLIKDVDTTVVDAVETQKPAKLGLTLAGLTARAPNPTLPAAAQTPEQRVYALALGRAFDAMAATHVPSEVVSQVTTEALAKLYGKGPALDAALERLYDYGRVIHPGWPADLPVPKHMPVDTTAAFHTVYRQFGSDPKYLRDAMASYVKSAQELDGNEHMVVASPDGRIIQATTTGDKFSTRYPGAVRDLLDTPGSDLMMVHNHPSGRSFSVYDMKAVAAPGAKSFAAEGSRGGAEASLTPQARDLLPRLGDPRHVLVSFYADARELVDDALEAFQQENLVSAEDAVNLGAHLTCQALDHAGLITYDYGKGFADLVDKVGESLKSIVAGVGDVVSARLKSAIPEWKDERRPGKVRRDFRTSRVDQGGRAAPHGPGTGTVRAAVAAGRPQQSPAVAQGKAGGNAALNPGAEMGGDQGGAKESQPGVSRSAPGQRVEGRRVTPASKLWHQNALDHMNERLPVGGDGNSAARKGFLSVIDQRPRAQVMAKNRADYARGIREAEAWVNGHPRGFIVPGDPLAPPQAGPVLSREMNLTKAQQHKLLQATKDEWLMRLMEARSSAGMVDPKPWLNEAQIYAQRKYGKEHEVAFKEADRKGEKLPEGTLDPQDHVNYFMNRIYGVSGTMSPRPEYADAEAWIAQNPPPGGGLIRLELPHAFGKGTTVLNLPNHQGLIENLEQRFKKLKLESFGDDVHDPILHDDEDHLPGDNRTKGRQRTNLGAIAKRLTGPRGVAANDRLSARFFQANEDKNRTAERLLHQGIEQVAPHIALSKAGRNRVYAAMEIERLEKGINDQPAPNVFFNEDHEHAALSKPGETVTLSPAEMKAKEALNGFFKQRWQDIVDAIPKAMGYQGTATTIDEIRAEASREGSSWYKKRLIQIADLMEMTQENGRKAYLPLMRFGDYYLVTKPRLGGDPIRGIPDVADYRLVDSLTPFETEWGKTVREGDIPASAVEALKEIRKKFPEKDYIVHQGYLSRSPDILKRLGIGAIDQLMTMVGNNVRHAANEQVRMGNMSQEQAQEYKEFHAKLIEALLDTVYQEMKANFRKHALDTPGYSKDFDRAIVNYNYHSSDYVARKLHGIELDQAWQDLQSGAHPSIVQYWKGWDEAQQARGDTFNAVGRRMRAVAFYYLMAGNIKSTIAVASHGFFVAIPTLSMFNRAGHVNPFLAAQEFTRAGSAVINGLRFKVKSASDFDLHHVGNARESAFLVNRDREGAYHNEAIDDLQGIQAAEHVEPFANKLRAIRTWCAANIRTMDKFTRVTTDLTALRLMMRPGGMAAAEKAFANNEQFREAIARNGRTPETMAGFIGDYASFAGGTRYASPIMRNELIKQWAFLRNFEFNFVRVARYNAMKMGPAGREAAGLMMGALLLVGGLGGLTGAYEVGQLLKFAYGKLAAKDDTGNERNLEDDVYRYMAAHLGWSAPQTEALLHGASRSLVGCDAESIGLGRLGELPSSPWDLLGAAVQVPRQGAVRAFQRGTPDQYGHEQSVNAAAAELLPRSVNNWLQAEKVYPDQGIMTASGKALIPANEITPEDKACRLLGFNSSHISRAREQAERVYDFTQSARSANPSQRGSFQREMQRANPEGYAIQHAPRAVRGEVADNPRVAP